MAKFNEPIGTGDVINTNFCKISVCEDRIANKVIIISTLDNLIKGALWSGCTEYEYRAQL